MKKKKTNKKSNGLKFWKEILIILVLSFVAYGNTIQNDYNIDDAYIVPLDSQNDVIKEGLSAIPKLLKSRYNQGEGVTYGYRPMGKITMVFEYMMWGNNPHNSHVINILLFALNIILLLVFLRMLTIIGIDLPPPVIYISLLLFLFHPIHTEVVASIKNREEVLCFIFMLLGLIMFLKFINSNNYLLFIPFIACIIVSTLSKETGVNVLGLVIIISIVKLRYSNKVNSNKLKFGLLSLFLLALGAIFVSLILLPSNLDPDNIAYSFEQNPYASFTSVYSIPNGIQTIFFYIKKLIVPFPLLFYYGYDMLPLQDWRSPITYIGIIIFLLLLLFILRTFISKRNPQIPFFIAVFAVCVFPFSNLLSANYITGIVGERLVYQASFPFCVIAALLIVSLSNCFKPHKRYKQKLSLFILVSPIIVAFIFFTVSRNQQWKNKETLYQHDIQYLSKSARANYMIANTYMKSLNQSNQGGKRSLISKAKNHLIRAIDVYPDYSEAKVKLGVIYGRYLNNIDSAFIYLESVVKDSSEYHLSSLEELGDLSMLKIKDINRAFKYYDEYWAIKKSNKFIYQKIQNVLFTKSKYDLIIKYAQEGINQSWLEAYIDMGDALTQLGRESEAMDYYQNSISKGYRNKGLEDRIRRFYKSKPPS